MKDIKNKSSHKNIILDDAFDRKYQLKNLNKNHYMFDNRKTKVDVTMDEAKLLNHVVWCAKCSSKFISLIIHAKTMDDKKLQNDVVTECNKLYKLV